MLDLVLQAIGASDFVALCIGAVVALSYRQMRPNGLKGAIEELHRSLEERARQDRERHRELMGVMRSIRDDQLRSGAGPQS